jgi:hypothetical protein
MEGLVLMMLYLIIAVSFWYYPVCPLHFNSAWKAELINRDQIQLLYLGVVILLNCFALLRGWIYDVGDVIHGNLDNMYHLAQSRCHHGIETAA